MEGTLRWSVVTAVAPVAWGANYFVTREFLPMDYPLYGAVFRALPAGLLLLAVRRELPHGGWWGKAAGLGTLNMGAFFALVYLAAQLLPTSVASTVMATSPVVMLVLAWLLLAERPRLLPVVGAVIGIGGVALMLGGASGVSVAGIAVSVAAMVMSSFGFVLTKRWSGGVNVLSLTSWQLLAGGTVLLPIAVVVEGAPPAIDPSAALGFGYVAVVATAIAYAAWFGGLQRLSAATVGLIGLLNPVAGVVLGTLLGSEAFSLGQAGGLVLVLAGITLGQPGIGRRRRRLGSLRDRRAQRRDIGVQPTLGGIAWMPSPSPSCSTRSEC
jgi:probable blue pigment (indigoidine) exporter